MLESSKKINICLACDNNYAPLAGVSIASFLKNSANDEYLSFFVLDNNISDENKKKISSLTKIKDCSIEFIQVESEKFENLYLPDKKGYLSICSYYRFLISSLFSHLDKILYVDCDVIATSSVWEYYNTDLDNFYAAVIKDTSCEENQVRLGFESKDIYFNAGVILINIAEWRKNNLELALFNSVGENLDDQDILNIVLKGRIRVVEDRWNWQGKSKNYSQTTPPNLIHFITAYKPWVTGSKRGFDNEYFKALALTPWNSFYDQHIRRFLPVIRKDRKFIHICFWGLKTRIKYV